ncbi:hypothetical protein LEAN103870_14950 [Legionella anisa]|uniref:Uncharacterized protein n=1 Tax=Legionella anisa TaxID=28082 RepID=A0AAX0WVB5_9GAMM|nr:hypothetical protein [Legionella anisa]AWN73520.1 hypothetical protein DLD14_06505 [Legionella anisa]KTC70828.1 hypothetical protein Lani_2375 [Legionella anisa]MBN5935332.1 hypothetical protein [Legionella anisa]MCW8426399.1 hypothetical protein [Legionella anisa]MCW8448059.1 hypothetical protein [Legionella anisa]
MRKNELAKFLDENQDSTLDEIHELRKSYESLTNLSGDDEIPAQIQEEYEHVVRVVYDPSVPHYPFRWKEFIPEIMEADLHAISDGFTAGDLVYGINGARIMLFNALQSEHRDDFTTRLANGTHKATIDPYIDIFLKDSSNPSDPFYVPAQSFKSYATLFKPELEQFSPSWRAEDNAPFIKKMSKLGIMWVLNNENKLHFVLNNIDYKMCFEKRFDKITFAELRFLYRHWEQFKPFYEEGKINFYFLKEKQLVKVDAPWESKPDIVSTYVPKHSHQKSYHAFFNSFIINLITNEIKTEKWRTGLWGFGGGSPITVDGQQIKVPHRVAQIYNIANDNTLSLAAKYLEVMKLAREAVDNPRKLQKPETTAFYQAILDFDKKLSHQARAGEIRFFRSKSELEQQQNLQKDEDTQRHQPT